MSRGTGPGCSPGRKETPLLTWPLATEFGPGVGLAVATLLYALTALGVTIHVLLTKQSTRAATGWIALAWLSPLLGAVLYLALGINRVRRRATALRPPRSGRVGPAPSTADRSEQALTPLSGLADAVGTLTGRPLVAGNTVTPLFDGGDTFPAMVAAIEGAETSVALVTFLWDDDTWGRRIADAVADAHDRGVEVRVLIDGIGDVVFSWPSAARHLVGRGVRVERFLWNWDPRRLTLVNLRNHRKILVVDGRVGFTGGMNARDAYMPADSPAGEGWHDLHARVEGPVVRELMELFAEDWAFTSAERLTGPTWFPPLPAVGGALARVIPDGPDEDLDQATLTFHLATACARRRIVVMSPYFLPESPLILALGTAARRGIQVDVLLPHRSNQRHTGMAMRAELPHVLAHGIRIWGTTGGFDHTKLMLVDDTWACMGSANWDPRSLRLNFEMLFEVHDAGLVRELDALVARRLDGAVRYERAAELARPWGRRVAESALRLLKPFL